MADTMGDATGAGDLILVLDAGTTSTRAMVFARDGRVLAIAQRAITQYYPRPGWVEHDPAALWETSLAVLREAVTAIDGPRAGGSAGGSAGGAAGGAGRIAALGMSTQRETVVAWDRVSGAALGRAIVWQDRRTTDACATLRAQGHEADVQARTGLVLDPYFSATKMRWLIDHVPEVADAARAGRLALGTVESWLTFRLTGGGFVSDASNASRTSLMPLAQEGSTARWDAGLCDLFGVPLAALAEIVDCVGGFGSVLPEWLGRAIPITALIGDQQAATIGQGCLMPGDTKATYGTGAFVLANVGATMPQSAHRLLGTVLYQLGGVRCYALEGSMFVAGSLMQWLRDAMGLIADAPESAQLAASVADSGAVVIVPALAGLGAPHWRPEARATITGLSFATTRAHVVRAALEAMACQTRDLAQAFAGDGAPWTCLQIDGGMSANDWMAQDLADVLELPVERPDAIETTALGAAMLAGLGAGLFASLAEASGAMRGPVRRFAPAMAEQTRAARLALWQAALAVC